MQLSKAIELAKNKSKENGHLNYLCSGENIIDLVQIIGGYGFIVMQICLGPRSMLCKTTLVILLLAMLFKFVYLMRIFPAFSKLKTMVITCII